MQLLLLLLRNVLSVPIPRPLALQALLLALSVGMGRTPRPLGLPCVSSARRIAILPLLQHHLFPSASAILATTCQVACVRNVVTDIIQPREQLRALLVQLTAILRPRYPHLRRSVFATPPTQRLDRLASFAAPDPTAAAVVFLWRARVARSARLVPSIPRYVLLVPIAWVHRRHPPSVQLVRFLSTLGPRTWCQDA